MAQAAITSTIQANCTQANPLSKEALSGRQWFPRHLGPMPESLT